MRVELGFDQKKRSVWVALPDRFDRFKKYPAVIALHGGGGTGDQMRTMTEFDLLGDREGFIAAFPDGTPALGNSMMTWNAIDCCGKAMRNEVDDVRFLDVLIDTLVRKYNADPKRIYMTGHSNGAMMTYRYACKHPERLAAIAANAGQEWYRDCVTTEHPVPILHLHGTADRCADYDGGESCGGCFADVLGLSPDGGMRPCLPVERAMELWAAAYQCDSDPRPLSPIGSVKCEAWAGCRGEADIRFCRIERAGHNWPGGQNDPPVCRTAPKSRQCRTWRNIQGTVNSDISATSFIWEYFKRHVKP